jgi:hypothetical protein
MHLIKPLAALGCCICLVGLAACSSDPPAAPNGETGAASSSTDNSAGSGSAPAAGDPGGSSPSDAAVPGAAPSVIPEQPAAGEAAVAGAPTGEPQDLKAALSRYADTDRVAIELLREDCAENRRCLEDVALLANYIANDCAHDSTCPKTMAGILDPLTQVQKTGLVSLPESYPLASELRQILARATHDEARDEAGRPAPTPTPEPSDASDGTSTPSS